MNKHVVEHRLFVFSGVGMVMRKLGATVKPKQIITVTGTTWNIKTQSTVKNTEIEFNLGEEFDETTADGRKVKVWSFDNCNRFWVCC